MKIDEFYTLTADSNNWILSYESEKKTNDLTGKEYTSKDEWYFPTIGDALKKYVDNSLKPCSSFVQLVDRIKDLNNKINLFMEKQLIY